MFELSVMELVRQTAMSAMEFSHGHLRRGDCLSLLDVESHVFSIDILII